jgi:MoxR-like ATPase
MPGKWNTEDIKVGATMETTFYPNPVKDSGFRYRATHLDGKRAPKVVLCDDPRIRPGLPCLIRVKTIRKPERDDRGAIEVEFVSIQQFRIEGVYLDPVVAKKLQILLESGLNILLDGPQGCGKTVLAKSIADSLGLEFVFFNCGAVVEATDFLATIQVRASTSGAPVTDFVKTDVLIKLEEAIEHPDRRYLIFFDEFNRCQESARNALMPALDATRRLFHPIENRFMQIPDNVQFIAAVNRGGEFTGTFGIDAAQLDRFAPLQVDYMPPDEETKLLQTRHPELGSKIVKLVVDIADQLRKTAELSSGLSIRATDEACTYLQHPLIATERNSMLAEVLKSSFCGRYNGRWSDVSSDAGAAWAVIERVLRERKQTDNGD